MDEQSHIYQAFYYIGLFTLAYLALVCLVTAVMMGLRLAERDRGEFLNGILKAQVGIRVIIMFLAIGQYVMVSIMSEMNFDPTLYFMPWGYVALAEFLRWVSLKVNRELDRQDHDEE